MITIVVPSRGRPSNIRRLVSSICDTAADISKIEIIVRLDKDDSNLEEYVRILNKFKIDITKIVGEKTENLSDLWNKSYKRVKYDRIMMMADDVIFRTKNWDRMVVEASPRPQNTVYLIWGNDLNQKQDLPTLPILSKAWIDNVGYFVPEGYVCDFCDTHIYDIAIRLKKIGHNCMVYLKNVVFEHMHPTIGKAKWDDVYNSRRKKRDDAAAVFEKRAGERQMLAQKISDLVKSGKLNIKK